MANGKVVKYKKRYEITIEGSSDMVDPEATPMFVLVFDRLISAFVDAMDSQYKSHNVKLEIK